jgi:hypothetical protein
VSESQTGSDVTFFLNLLNESHLIQYGNSCTEVQVRLQKLVQHNLDRTR